MIENAKKVDGWMSDGELAWLAKQAKNCMVIIECGSYKGRSTMALADNCPGVVISVDPFSGPYFYDNGAIMKHIGDNIFMEFEHNLHHHLKSNKVLHCRCRFHEFESTLIADMVFIDGDHRYEEVKKDINRAKELLKFGGILAGHDYIYPDWPGVKKAVDECVGEVEVYESIWWKII